MNNQKPILIAGPTASGKSALAMALAERLGGMIINADSMQVYRELRVLTARPSLEDEARVPHELFGFVPVREAYSAARYAADAALAIAEAQASGLRPIVVGGTGLYFKALLQGLSPIPEIPAEIRAYWRRRAAEVGVAVLHAELAARDAETAARLAPTDPQRIVRALEVIEATGRPLAEWQRLPGVPVIHEDRCVKLVVSLERDEIYRRSDARFLAMLEHGAIEEACGMAALRLDPQLPAMRALGLRPLIQLHAGEIGREEAVRRAQAETRQFIKRQLTWLRGNMIAWNSVSQQEMQSYYDKNITFVDA